MKSVLVFGLSGFIGSSIKKFLSKYKKSTLMQIINKLVKQKIFIRLILI